MILPSQDPDAITQKRELENRILEYSIEEMEELLGWLKGVIKERKQLAVKSQKRQKNGREVLEARRAGTVNYQLEMIKCGKKKCKCAKGKLHGPYWYAYWIEDNKLKSKYIGKTKPADLEQETAETTLPAAEIGDGQLLEKPSSVNEGIGASAIEKPSA